MDVLAAPTGGASVEGMLSHPDPLQALVFVRLGDPSPVRFERFLRGADGIVAAWHVIGDIDLAVQVHCPDLAALDRLLTAMRIDVGAAGTSTHLVVRQAELPGAPDLRCPSRPPAQCTSGTGVTFRAPESPSRRTRSLRRAGR